MDHFMEYLMTLRNNNNNNNNNSNNKEADASVCVLDHSGKESHEDEKEDFLQSIKIAKDCRSEMEKVGQWLWGSWWSGGFLHRKYPVWVPPSAFFKHWLVTCKK